MSTNPLEKPLYTQLDDAVAQLNAVQNSPKPLTRQGLKQIASSKGMTLGIKSFSVGGSEVKTLGILTRDLQKLIDAAHTERFRPATGFEKPAVDPDKKKPSNRRI